MTERDIRSRVLARRALRVQRGAARAAVLGVNDGLVSVLCLVLAMAGAGASVQAVLLAGLAGLISGAISMAAGEWISVRAQAELFDGIVRKVGHLARSDQSHLSGQLTEQFEKSGYSKKVAQAAVGDIAVNEHRFTDAYIQQVMGFNPHELGSPWTAAISSFALFITGALVPLAPWFFTNGTLAVGLSVGVTGLASLAVGGYIAFSSGRNIAYGAIRQLLIVVLASVVTYGVGYLFGVSVG
jgi:vacuolar iron transporter family protein